MGIHVFIGNPFRGNCRLANVVMKTGDLIRLKCSDAMWIALDANENSIFALNMKTNYAMWANAGAFEMISAIADDTE